MNALTPRSHIAHATSRDGAVLLDTERGRFFGLNSVGSLIWTGLAEDKSIDQITRDLGALFSVPTPQLRSDVEGLIAQFLRLDLVASDCGESS